MIGDTNERKETGSSTVFCTRKRYDENGTHESQNVGIVHRVGDRVDSNESVLDRLRITILGYTGDSEFLRSTQGRDTANVMMLMDELMSTLQVISPRLYNGVMRKLKEVE